MSVKTDLIAARALIDTPEKWRKGGYGFGSAMLCGSAAICEAVRDSNAPFVHPSWMAVLSQLPKGFRSICEFNDYPTTTHNDVLALFDRAIEASS